MIKVENLTKTFRIHKKAPGFIGSLKSLIWREFENKHALKELSLTIDSGEMIGLLGANGAGKTTLVKILSGIIHRGSGEASVMGFDPWDRKNEYRKQIALIMGQKAQLWWDLPAADCFLLLRNIYQIPKQSYQETLDELADVLAVKDLLTTQIRRLSLGERMKMELIAALLHKPKVVFLDEPTIGLDISSQRSLRRFLKEYHQRYRPTMIITSHYMEDIEALCERILIIRKGELIFDGSLKNLMHDFAKQKKINVQYSNDKNAEPAPIIKSLSEIDPGLGSLGEVIFADDQSLQLQIDRNQIPKVASTLLQKFPVADLNIEEIDIGTIVAKIQHQGTSSDS